MSGRYVPPHRRNTAGEGSVMPRSSSSEPPSSSDERAPAPTSAPRPPMSYAAAAAQGINQPRQGSRAWRCPEDRVAAGASTTTAAPAPTHPSARGPPAGVQSERPASSSSIEPPTERMEELRLMSTWRQRAESSTAPPAAIPLPPSPEDQRRPQPVRATQSTPAAPQSTAAATDRKEVPSKHLQLAEMTPCRVIFVKNPTGEISWRGHPGFVLDVAGRACHVITLTTWKGKTCVEKWAGAEDPAKYRRWFCLVDDRRTGSHDACPVMRLAGGRTLPKLCYVDCKRTHWLDISEVEKYRMPGGETELWVERESIEALKRHLVFLDTLESPWVDQPAVDGAAEGEEDEW